jgi:hypothetical protein
MTRYIVEPATHLQTHNTAALKEALRSLTSIVEEFARAHEGKVAVLQGVWLNTTLAIDTDAQTAEELSHVPGIGKVERPNELTRD